VHDVPALIAERKASQVVAQACLLVLPEAAKAAALHFCHAVLSLHARNGLFDSQVDAEHSRLGTVELCVTID